MRQARAPAAAVALIIITAAIAAGLLPVLLIGVGEGFSTGLFDAYLYRVVVFTLLQAGLSTLLSVVLALPVARALARRDFPGRGVILRLFALPLALPAIVVILGVVEVYGRNGWLAAMTGWPLDIYGLSGILIAHVFFNLPLAARLLLLQLDDIAPESWRLSAQLGFGERESFRFVEWPVLRQALPGIASLIFLLCAASFAVVLTLGGGPQATTLEVAIYQALRFDYDPARATVLALLQLLVCAGLIGFAASTAGAAQGWPALRRGVRPPAPGGIARAFDGVAILFAAGFVAIPILAIAVSGVMAHFDWEAIASAAFTSVLIAAGGMIASIALAWPLAQAMARNKNKEVRAAMQFTSLLPLIVPPAVLATGWFIIALRAGMAFSLAPILVIAMNALMALPFALGTLATSVERVVRENDRLCASLGVRGLARLELIDLPLLKRPVGLAAAMAFVLSLGDLTAIMLFGSQNLTTLPALIYAQMGSYRLDDAAGSALALAVFSMVFITLIDLQGARRDHA
ncbi:thiamine/thiamine pyrophosphate ABC transporter permease ThiP [soil metagenome]